VNSSIVVPYRNLSGDSGVVAYEIRPASVIVRFRGGLKYEYTNQSAGASAVTRMKRLAAGGRGLGTFISQVVRDKYERKFR
jgi:hypothetical protein